MAGRRFALYCSIFTSVSALPSIAVAQNAPGGLDEIVVTAQRRDENLQDTPVTVSAFSEDMLDTRQIARTTGDCGPVPTQKIALPRPKKRAAGRKWRNLIPPFTQIAK